jgi:hypothetical protein
MKLPLEVRFFAAMAGLHSKEFMIGWANGMVRWQGRVGDRSGDQSALYVYPSDFERGSVKFAASEAAVTFMREKARR